MLEMLLSGGKRKSVVESAVIAIEVLSVKMTTPITAVIAVEALTTRSSPPVSGVIAVGVLTKKV